MECQLCGNIAQDQRSLRCGHSFCIQCLESRLEVKDGYSRVSFTFFFKQKPVIATE